MWALCRLEYGLTWSEFQSLTLAQYEALQDRRDIALRHARFNTALVAAAIINSNRIEGDPVSPFDFLPGFDIDPLEAEKEKLRQSVKKAVAVAFTEMGSLSREQLLEEKARMVRNMTAEGIEDAEELILEVFPNLAE